VNWLVYYKYTVWMHGINTKKMRCDICEKINISKCLTNMCLQPPIQLFRHVLNILRMRRMRGVGGARSSCFPFFRLYSLAWQSRFCFVFQPRHKGKYRPTYVWFAEPLAVVSKARPSGDSEESWGNRPLHYWNLHTETLCGSSSRGPDCSTLFEYSWR
jgi:hypothetical protein